MNLILVQIPTACAYQDAIAATQDIQLVCVCVCVCVSVCVCVHIPHMNLCVRCVCIQSVLVQIYTYTKHTFACASACACRMGLPVVFKAAMCRSAYLARDVDCSRASVGQLLSQAALAAHAGRKGVPRWVGGVCGGPLRCCLMQCLLGGQLSAAVADVV